MRSSCTIESLVNHWVSLVAMHLDQFGNICVVGGSCTNEMVRPLDGIKHQYCRG